MSMASNQNLSASDIVPVEKTDQTSDTGWIPLHRIVKDGDVSALCKMLKLRPDINIQMSGGYTPLHIAVCERQLECFRLLLDAGAKGYIRDDYGMVPLHHAALNGEVRMLKELTCCECIDVQDNEMRTPLHIALMNENLHCANALLNAGADVHMQDSRGATPLHITAEIGCEYIIRKLIDLKADVNKGDKFKYTPLHIAVRKGILGCVGALINAGADIDAKGGTFVSPLRLAVVYGHKSIWKKLLGMKPLAIRNRFELFSLLEAVIYFDRLDYMDDLVEAGVSLDTRGYMRRTLLHSTVVCDEFMLKKILELNLDMNAQDGEGMTPLHVMCGWKKLQNVLLLLDAGGRWDIRDNYGQTMLWHLFSSLREHHLSSDEFTLLKRILEITNDGIEIMYNTGQTASHVMFHRSSWKDFHIELIELVVSTQKNLMAKTQHFSSLIKYVIDQWIKFQPIVCAQLIRMCIKYKVYLTQQDCDKIIHYPNLRDNILRDIDLCTKSIANKFNNHTLQGFNQQLGQIPHIPSIEMLKITPECGAWRIIEQDVRSEIERKGYCDTSRLVTTSLSKRCIEAYCKARSCSDDLQIKQHQTYNWFMYFMF